MRILDNPSNYPDIHVRQGMKKEALRSGLFSVDYISEGGFPVGEISEIYGEAGSGKTAVALRAIAEAQDDNKICAFVDMEKAFPLRLAKASGVDTSSLILLSPEYGEDAFQMMERLIETDDLDLLVLDSVSALFSRKDKLHSLSSEQESVSSMLQRFLPHFFSLLRTTGTTILFLNQIRQNNSFVGSSESAVGGNILKHYASLRIRMECGEILKQDSQPIGQEVFCTATNCTSILPGRKASLDVFYDIGADDIRFLADALERASLLSFSEHGTLLFDGKEFHSYKDFRNYWKQEGRLRTDKIERELVQDLPNILSEDD